MLNKLLVMVCAAATSIFSGVRSGDLAPRASVLLPVAYLAHLGEEWWGGAGFSAWTQSTLGAGVSPGRFVLINAIAWPLLTFGIIAALRRRNFAWFAATFAALVTLNGLLHLFATAAFSTYSPGVVTGLLLYIPLGGFVLLAMSRSLPPAVFGGAILAGAALHALVAVAAFA